MTYQQKFEIGQQLLIKATDTWNNEESKKALDGVTGTVKGYNSSGTLVVLSLPKDIWPNDECRLPHEYLHPIPPKPDSQAKIESLLKLYVKGTKGGTSKI
jgi:hypothetical protein